MPALYYANGAPTHCMTCGHKFSELDGHLMAVHIKTLGYSCSSRCAKCERERLLAEESRSQAS
jgi:hypothetical protein